MSNVFSLRMFLVIMPLCVFLLSFCLTSILLTQEAGAPRRKEGRKEVLTMCLESKKVQPKERNHMCWSLPNTALTVERNDLF